MPILEEFIILSFSDSDILLCFWSWQVQLSVFWWGVINIIYCWMWIKTQANKIGLTQPPCASFDFSKAEWRIILCLCRFTLKYLIGVFVCVFFFVLEPGSTWTVTVTDAWNPGFLHGSCHSLHIPVDGNSSLPDISSPFKPGIFSVPPLLHLVCINSYEFHRNVRQYYFSWN